MRCRDVLVRLTGGPGAAFRPSGTDDGTVSPGDQVLVGRGGGRVRAPCSASTSTRSTTRTPVPTAVTERTLAAVTPGSIVSLHFGHPGTVTALPAILDGLDQRELTPVTVSTLLG